MQLTYITVGGVAVPVAVENREAFKKSLEAIKEEENRLFETTEGLTEAGKFGIVPKRRDDI